MPMRPRLRSCTFRNLPWAGICVLTALLLVIATRRSTGADDAPPAPSAVIEPPGRMAEELDLFKERSKEANKRARAEEKTKKKPRKAPPTIRNTFSWTPGPTTDVGDGPGMIDRIGHNIGSTFGNRNSLTPLELMPYMLTDEHFFFGDVRGFVTNNSQVGGNLGIGYRHLREDLNAWGGASLWYDADNSTSKLFQQVGLSFEGLIQRFELRSNVYIPVTSNQTISNSVGSAAIVGNQLLYGRSINVGTPMTGVDAEFGYSLPVRERHVVRGFVGGYHFESSSISSVNGFKARVEGVINNGVTAQVMYTNDNLYGSTAMVGMSLQFPFGNNHPTSGWKQHTPSPFRFVERNYNVIVSQRQDTSGSQIATDPTTGNAYKVEQVFVAPPNPLLPAPASAATADGTTSNPFSSVAAAQAAGGNVMIVQSGSVLNEAIALKTGEHLFGQGTIPESLALKGGGTIQIPNLVQASQVGSTIRNPVLGNSNGTAVTLASNTEVAGFTLSGSSGNGISGTNVSGISLHDLSFSGNTGDAINLANSSGNVTLRNIQINSGGGNGVVFDGGTANIAFYGAGNSITVTGDGVDLANLTGGNVDISKLTVLNTGAAGLSLNSVGTGVAIDSLTATGTGGPAVLITGNTGKVEPINGVSTNVYNTYNFSNVTAINAPKGTGFSVNNTDAIINVTSLNVTSSAASPAVSLVSDQSSSITIANMILNTNGGTGLSAVGLKDLIVSGGTITTVNGSGVDIQSSTINTTFKTISVDGANVGVNLARSLGTFTVTGGGGLGSGGLIQNTTTGVKIASFGTTNISWMNFLSNGTAIQSTASSQLNLHDLQISGSTGYAIDSTDDAFVELANSNLGAITTNGSVGGGTIRIQADTVGTYQSLLQNNVIIDANGTAIQYQTTGNGAGASLLTTIASNSISGLHGGSPVVNVNWNGPAETLISNNYLYAWAPNMTAILLQDPSLTNSLLSQVNNNLATFELGATHGTGLSVIAGAP